MNIGWGSECCSGCESGWTMYLDQYSSPSANPCKVGGGGFGHPLGIYGKGDTGKDAKVDDDGVAEPEEEEDLSMVSDASSGPPHFHEDEEDNYSYDENAYFCSSTAALEKKTGRRGKILEHRHQRHPSSFLDDTASSPIVSLSKNNLTLTENQASGENVLSQGFSGNHFKGKSSFQKHFSFLPAGKSSSSKTSYLQGREWE
ncbi:protein SOB FIVE-LIKE 5-like [Macadamia integrifolia]|uniref:protein SOB FIVE-LIKE 5-like n=1 Tax=Macadamia integrifolia TaxID=60698 RepID=UPI001C4E4EBD|nr:protein SOB FIVE-LIKE 5-like [Macadamia integrifolia]